MTRACNPLYFPQEVGFRCIVAAIIAITKIFHSAPVSRAQIFSNYFFGDVSTDVLAVVARFLGLWLLLFGFEDLW